MQVSDEELYQRLRQGDRAAFDELYQRREPGLFRFALHMCGARALAEDFTHEAFVNLIRDNSRFDAGRGSVEAYLYGTVRNLARAAARRATEPFPTDVPAEVDVLDAIIADEAARNLHAAIRRLPEAYRETVVLCDLEERSYEDAARLLECAVGTVRSRLHRARALLAGQLRPVAGRAAR